MADCTRTRCNACRREERGGDQLHRHGAADHTAHALSLRQYISHVVVSSGGGLTALSESPFVCERVEPGGGTRSLTTAPPPFATCLPTWRNVSWHCHFTGRRGCSFGACVAPLDRRAGPSAYLPSCTYFDTSRPRLILLPPVFGSNTCAAACRQPRHYFRLYPGLLPYHFRHFTPAPLRWVYARIPRRERQRVATRLTGVIWTRRCSGGRGMGRFVPDIRCCWVSCLTLSVPSRLCHLAAAGAILLLPHHCRHSQHTTIPPRTFCERQLLTATCLLYAGMPRCARWRSRYYATLLPSPYRDMPTHPSLPRSADTDGLPPHFTHTVPFLPHTTYAHTIPTTPALCDSWTGPALTCQFTLYWIQTVPQVVGHF